MVRVNPALPAYMDPGMLPQLQAIQCNSHLCNAIEPECCHSQPEKLAKDVLEEPFGDTDL